MPVATDELLGRPHEGCDLSESAGGFHSRSSKDLIYLTSDMNRIVGTPLGVCGEPGLYFRSGKRVRSRASRRTSPPQIRAPNTTGNVTLLPSATHIEALKLDA